MVLMGKKRPWSFLSTRAQFFNNEHTNPLVFTQKYFCTYIADFLEKTSEKTGTKTGLDMEKKATVLPLNPCSVF